MNFPDGHLHPENQHPLTLTAAPVPSGLTPADSPVHLPNSMDEQDKDASDL